MCIYVYIYIYIYTIYFIEFLCFTYRRRRAQDEDPLSEGSVLTVNNVALAGTL